MQPLEKQDPMDDTNDLPDAVEQLSFAQESAREVLEGSDEALAQGVRRAEAILFAAGEPLSAEQISEVLPHGVEAAQVLMAIRAIYAPRGVTLVEVAGKWRFQTAQDLAYLFVEERQVQKKLGQAALETLAIIAYSQPSTRAEVEAVRGVAVSKVTVDTLLETGWIKMAGQRKTPGQPMQYATTQQFLEHFGLESLDTLPGKADLDAEGLLSEAIPAGFQMPDEEALSEEDMLIDDTEDMAEPDAFVTDFLDAEADADDVVADVDVNVALAEDSETHDDALIEGADVVAPEIEADTVADTEEGVSVFAYTREAEETDTSDSTEMVSEDVDTVDESAIEAAVIKLSKEPREPERPMWTWDDED
jgi:segregation and condensation protein B